MVVPFQFCRVSRHRGYSRSACCPSRARSYIHISANETVMEKLVGGMDSCMCARVQQGDRTAWLPRFAGRGASRPSADPQSQAPAEKLLFPFFFRRGSSRSDQTISIHPIVLLFHHRLIDHLVLIAALPSSFFRLVLTFAQLVEKQTFESD